MDANYCMKYERDKFNIKKQTIKKKYYRGKHSYLKLFSLDKNFE